MKIRQILSENKANIKQKQRRNYNEEIKKLVMTQNIKILYFSSHPQTKIYVKATFRENPMQILEGAMLSRVSINSPKAFISYWGSDLAYIYWPLLWYIMSMQSRECHMATYICKSLAIYAKEHWSFEKVLYNKNGLLCIYMNGKLSAYP